MFSLIFVAVTKVTFGYNFVDPLSMTKVIRKKVLTSSKLKFNFESSTGTVEVIRTRFPCPGLPDMM